MCAKFGSGPCYPGLGTWRRMNAQNNKATVLSWRGLLGEENIRVRLGVFAALLVISASMTFVQLGFIGVGGIGDYAGYAFGLLAPVTVASLLLGKEWGTLEGVAAGAVLWLHARVQPLDIIEKFFVNWLSSLVLYAAVGFFMGLLFALTLRKGPRGALRFVALLVPCLVVSVLVGEGFDWFLGWRLDELNTSESIQAFLGTGLTWVQVVCDFVLTLAVSLVADAVVRWYVRSKSYVSVRTIFRARLLASLVLIFMTVSAVGFVTITKAAEQTAYEDISDELEYIGGEFAKRWGSLGDVLSMPEVMDLPDNVFINIADGIAPERLLDGYTLDNGTVAIYVDGVVILTNNYAIDENGGSFKENVQTPDENVVAEEEGAVDGADAVESSDAGATASAGTSDTSLAGGDPQTAATSDSIDSTTADEDYDIDYEEETGLVDGMDEAVAEIAKSGEMRMMVYDDGNHYELGYMRAIQAQLRTTVDGKVTYQDADGCYIMMARPFSMIFERRSETMLWASLSTFVLMVGIYLLVSRLLRQNLIGPVDRTNASLAKIMGGDFDEQVSEVGSVEFAALSAGINSTVDSLKEYAAESARRIEQDLATARRIQIGALPKQFPAFPNVDAIDLYASMDAAKEVGGDFYDFLEVDERTVAFLIADVSGKGIPGALFMMAAKAEIQNHLSSGIAPAEAIARANQYLCAHNEAGMFVTVWAATLDWQTGLLTYVNAGHNFPLLRRGRDGSWEWLKKKCGLFLGTFETARYRQETLTLEPGDELLLYTDGVNEAFNVDEEEYGNARLEAFLADHADLNPKQVVTELRADVAAWAEGAEQSDDVTIMAVEFS